MQTEKIETINGEELMNLVLPSLRFAVDGLLPQGVHILSGGSKTGKSWLVLALGLAVAEGKPFWGRETDRGDVLYLCLEDSLCRLQLRVLSFTDEPPDRMHFAVLAKSLEDGLPEQINLFLDEYPDTRLIVIDTLQKVRVDRAGNYYRAARIERAKILLTTTEESVHDIAERLQFCAPSYFSEVFRKTTGQLPLDYRYSETR